jgi:uncharacterized protein (DUF1499 family)
MTTVADAPQRWRTIARIAVKVGGLLALASLLLLVAVPLGWRADLWHYRVSLLTLLPAAGDIAFVAAVISLLSLIGWAALDRRARLGAIGALLVAAIVFVVPWQYRQPTGAPRINDISTDNDDPPAFVASLTERAAAKANPLQRPAETARLQGTAYPDIAPAATALAPAAAHERALAAARAMPGWQVVAADAGAGRIEAKQSSAWMGFTDDVVIRVRAEGTGSRVDVRSVSRYGRGDRGVNAARVRAYLAALKPRL